MCNIFVIQFKVSEFHFYFIMSYLKVCFAVFKCREIFLGLVFYLLFNFILIREHVCDFIMQ